MPDQPFSPTELHEQFVREMKEIDWAHHEGRLHEWLQEKLTREQRNARAAADTADA